MANVNLTPDSSPTGEGSKHSASVPTGSPSLPAERGTGDEGLHPFRLLAKLVALFAAFNVLYFLAQPLNLLNHVTVYNLLVPGRERLPFSEYPAESYNLSIVNLDQMLASHQIARPKAPGEYRVVMVGDSAVWGYLLKPTETQAACLDRLGLVLPSGRRVRVYNLGYPKLTALKDVLILRRALDYQPDLILWPITLASLYPADQLQPSAFPMTTANYGQVRELVEHYHFNLPDWPIPAPTWQDQTFFGQRRDLANWLRYQLYGLAWMATGVDHATPYFVPPHPTVFAPGDENIYSPNIMHVATPKQITESDISLDIVKAGIGIAQAKNVPVLLINEPIYRSSTSDVRWNTYYPKWAYDTYRETLHRVAAREGWHYLDMWDAAPNDQFTDTDFHLTPAANCAYAEKLREPLLALATAPQS